MAKKVEPFVIVIFGGTGDLSQRKLLPSLFHLFHIEKRLEQFSIIGIGSRSLSDGGYRSMAKESLKDFAKDYYSEKKCDEFLKHLSYMSMDLKEESNYKSLCQRIGKGHEFNGERCTNMMFYLAVPPQLLPVIVENLEKVNVCECISKSKIVIEKPFGSDKQTAIELNQLISKAFDEKQIYRIDHYLGKDTVQSIIFFRFGNSIFEPLWNRRYIDHVQITVSEDLGIGHRGKFYEQSGVVRDIVQNHIMQLIALVGMEPPVGFEADYIRDEKIKVLRTIRPAKENTINNLMVRGQYGPGTVGDQKVCGYREEENVSFESNVPTFFAGKFCIDNWRWAGVPFYVRTGKRMPKKGTEIYIEFKQPPLKLFKKMGGFEPNGLIFSIQPNEAICLRLSVKQPGIGNDPHPVYMSFNYEKSFGFTQAPAYERLLIDAIKGDLTLFARQDGVEAMWGVVDPIIRYWDKVSCKKFPNYAAGTWGPKEADELIQKDGRTWRNS